MKLRNYLLSWDTVAGIVAPLVTALCVPSQLDSGFVLSIYGIGINVLSIIFSLFFASSAIIMTSSDNDFIRFLEEGNDFTGLLTTFKVTLVALFVSLLYALVLYGITDYQNRQIHEPAFQHVAWFLVFEGFFVYSLISTGLSAKDTIKFSSRRARFLTINNASHLGNAVSNEDSRAKSAEQN
jgi:hypothetical protein